MGKHKNTKVEGLQGLASAMLERASKQDEDAKAATAKKAAKKAKKQSEIKKLRKAARKAAGGHTVHLDLSGDDDDAAEDDKVDEKQSLDSFMDLDDDDDGSCRAASVSCYFSRVDYRAAVGGDQGSP